MTGGGSHVPHKWGFGMAPPKAEMERRRAAWVDHSLRLVEQPAYSRGRVDQVTEAISEVKGLVTRSLRKDQWDWLLVYVRLGCPPVADLRRAVEELVQLRRAVLEGDADAVAVAAALLQESGTSRMLNVYKRGGAPAESGVGFVYVLSTRDQPRMLKIGYTNRPIDVRVAEINRATGVVVPYGARTVWRVVAAREVEAVVHQALADYRVRPDREFFDLEFTDAAKVIADLIASRRLEPRSRSVVPSEP
ncbi:MAG: GIY-YIG nuclease family protein [Pseudonocardiaceae bacterium]